MCFLLALGLAWLELLTEFSRQWTWQLLIGERLKFSSTIKHHSSFFENLHKPIRITLLNILSP